MKCANKKLPRKKTSIHQQWRNEIGPNFSIYARVCAQHTLRISLKHAIFALTQSPYTCRTMQFVCIAHFTMGHHKTLTNASQIVVNINTITITSNDVEHNVTNVKMLNI